MKTKTTLQNSQFKSPIQPLMMAVLGVLLGITAGSCADPCTLSCSGDISVSNDAGECGAVVNYPGPNLSGDCSGVTIACDHTSGSFFPVGTTTVNCTATSGDVVVDQCSFDVTVVDNETPTITCPANLAVNAAPRLCTSNVTYSVVATDNCEVASVVPVPFSGFAFPVGTTTVTSTARDLSGNRSICTFTVTVNDTQPPLIICPANRAVNAAPGLCTSNVTFFGLATDNCAVTNVTSIPPSGFAFPVGTTTVTSTARDFSGNPSTCTFTVTVNDTQPPLIQCPANLAVNAAPGLCMSNVTFLVLATDNCAVTNVTSIPPSGFAFPVGTTTVTSTAQDFSGNPSTCTFTVTVETGNKCPLAQGYWRNHTSLWPASAIPMTLGSESYSQAELVTIVSSSTTTDASLILARQLIAAILNTANGSDPGPICATVAQAQALLSAHSEKLPYGVKASSAEGQQMISLANMLESYNLDELTAGCTP